MTLAIQNIDETFKALLKLQEETEQAVKEAGEALRIYIEKSAIIHNNRWQQTMKLPIVIKDGVATNYQPLKKSKKSKPNVEQNSEKKMSLKAAIKTILSRNSTGFKVVDIVDVIEEEQLWTTDKDNLVVQVKSNLSTMKTAGLIDRNEDGLYRLID